MEINKIVEFLKTHRLISVRALEKEVGIPDTALSAIISGHRMNLAKKHIPKLKKILKNYGYERDLPLSSVPDTLEE